MLKLLEVNLNQWFVILKASLLHIEYNILETILFAFQKNFLKIFLRSYRVSVEMIVRTTQRKCFIYPQTTEKSIKMT